MLLQVLQFCYAKDLILCRLLFHTSYKLQSCGVAVFGPLKTACQELDEGLERGGASTIRKQHFIFLYEQARHAALTTHSFMSG